MKESTQFGLPSWVYPSSVVDLDFARSRYYQQGQSNDISKLLTVSRTTSGGGTATAYSQNNLNFNTFGDNVPRISDNGLFSETTRNNLFRNSFSPATQTRTVTNGTKYIISVYGTGSVTLSDALTGSASQGTPFVGTAGSTSLTFTIVGSVTTVQCESASGTTANPTTPISTASGASSTRNPDIVTLTNVPSIFGPASVGSVFCIFLVPNNTAGGTMYDISDGSQNNRLTTNFIPGDNSQCGTTVVQSGVISGYDPDLPFYVSSNVLHCYGLTWKAFGNPTNNLLTDCIDGSTITSNNNRTDILFPIGMNRINLGSQNNSTNLLNGYIKRFILTPTYTPPGIMQDMTLRLLTTNV